LRHLSLGYLDTTLAQTKQDMGDSWTTVGLNRNIREITRLAINLAEEINIEGHTIKKHADDLYQLFWSKHGFEKTAAVALDMGQFIQHMQALEKVTEEFCSSPVNLLTEKNFLIRKFFLGLGVQIQAIFEQAHLDCTHWLNLVIGELKNQISTHKIALDQRAESLMQAHNNADQVVKNIAATEKDLAKYQEQSNQLDATLLKLMRSVQFNTDSHQEHSTGDTGTLLHLNIAATTGAGEREGKPSIKYDAPFI